VQAGKAYHAAGYPNASSDVCATSRASVRTRVCAIGWIYSGAIFDVVMGAAGHGPRAVTSSRRQ
jgi:hypothetical protein